MPTRKELESNACDLEKRLKEREGVLKLKEVALSHAAEDMEEWHSDRKMHENNMNFMLHKAEVVDIREFDGVKKLLQTTSDKLAEASIKYHNLLKTVTAHRKEYNDILKELDELREELSGYPVILKFPEKK